MPGQLLPVIVFLLALCLGSSDARAGEHAQDDPSLHDKSCLRSTGTHIVYHDLKDHCTSPGGLLWQPMVDRDVRIKPPPMHVEQHFNWKPGPFRSSRSKVRGDSANRPQAN